MAAASTPIATAYQRTLSRLPCMDCQTAVTNAIAAWTSATSLSDVATLLIAVVGALQEPNQTHLCGM